MARLVARSESGARVGETHPNATISDEVVDQIRMLREERGLTYGQIAIRVRRPKGTIQKICAYTRRATRVERWVLERRPKRDRQQL